MKFTSISEFIKPSGDSIISKAGYQVEGSTLVRFRIVMLDHPPPTRINSTNSPILPLP